MTRRNVFAMAGLLLCTQGGAHAQMPGEAATVEIEIQNLVIYRHDVVDATKLALDAIPTTPLPLRNFMNVTWIGDIVTVNGAAAKGTLTVRGQFVNLNPSPTPGTGIADTTNALASEWIFDIARADGVPVGTMVASGWAFGARAAGFPAPGQGNIAILGGTGAFLGMRGQAKETSVAMGPQSFASVTEDPANRRSRPGRTSRYTLDLFPLTRADFVRTENGPQVFHSDFSPVTPANPARPGEVLIAAVTGLGPTTPGKPSGTPFPEQPFQEVASPVGLLVNGASASVENRIGWPGTTATYRVDFRVPEQALTGMAKVQLVSGWIPGPEALIPVQ